MFFSLKWKAVLFLSVVLLIMTIAWINQSVTRSQDVFNKIMNEKSVYHKQTINEILSNNFFHLSVAGQLITESPSVKNSITDNNEIKSFIEKSWINYNINIGLDYLGIYDSNKKRLIHASTAELNDQKRRLHEIIMQNYLQKAINGEPQSFIFCNTSCLQIIVEPFLDGKGNTGVIAIGQNMADVVRLFLNYTQSSLAILIENNTVNIHNKDKYLSRWHANAWAISDYKSIYPILQNISSHNSITTIGNTQIEKYDKKYYFFNEIEHSNNSKQGLNSLFLVIDDYTEDYQDLERNIFSAVMTGITVWFLAEFILILFITSIMSRLSNLSNSLILLPEQKFKAAIKLLKRKKVFVKDELSLLEENMAHVASELEGLNREITRKNETLNNKIEVINRSKEFLSRLFENSKMYIVTLDRNSNIISSNKLFESLHEKLPETFSEILKSQELVNNYNNNIMRLYRGEISSCHNEMLLYDKNYNAISVVWTHSLIEDEDGNEIILSIGADLTKQKQAEKELKWLANHDPLTNLHNRRSFNESFDAILNSGTNGALVFIDVNHFKQINDIYGHAVGDAVLLDIASVLNQQTRSTDLVSRLAGDEFTIILSRVSLDNIEAILEKFSAALSREITTEHAHTFSYTVSIGAALFPLHSNDAQSLIINADMAMYNAKKRGSGLWHLYSPDDEGVSQIFKDHKLIQEVKLALTEDRLNLVFQPIQNILTKDISHYEVLLRMTDSAGNNVSPAEFIPVAEKMKEIGKLDEWVIDNALAELSRLTNTKPDIKFAINISAPTLQTDGLPTLLHKYFMLHNIEANKVIVELTETAYIENFQKVLNNLSVLSSCGVLIALDDFGVGFSSFTYLKKLPLTYVKLDGSYIRNLIDDKSDQIFVKNLSAMINGFGMETIAEFVENQETLDMLASLNVTYAQGYHISKPKSYEDTFLQTSNNIISFKKGA